MSLIGIFRVIFFSLLALGAATLLAMLVYLLLGELLWQAFGTQLPPPEEWLEAALDWLIEALERLWPW